MKHRIGLIWLTGLLAHASPVVALGSLTQQAYVKSSDPVFSAHFGFSVSLSGDTLAVGAPGNNAVYIYVRYSTAWLPQAVLRGVGSFGDSVALSGDTLVVGADQYYFGGTASGAAYVFVRNQGNWTQQAFLTAPRPEAFDQFGCSVAISGDTVIIGAPYESRGPLGNTEFDGPATRSGAAYTFVRTNGVWAFQAYLKGSNSSRDGWFGFSVAISGDTAAVGAIGYSSFSGSAYVYTRQSGVWIPQAFLTASNPDSYDQFGQAIALSGNTLIVGAPNEASNATGVDGNQNNNSAVLAGAAYVFVRAGGWMQQSYLKAAKTGFLAPERFGLSVAAADGVLVVGAPGEATGDDSTAGAGATYVFDWNGSKWTPRPALIASNAAPEDQYTFGLTVPRNAVSISGQTVVFGAPNQDTGAANSGAAYVFAPVVDTTPPVITPAVVGNIGAGGWHTGAVTVNWTVTDPESGIVTMTGCNSSTLSAETPGTILQCSARNGAGLWNSSAVTVRIDNTPPSITGMPQTCSLWPPNHKLVQVAVLTAADVLSGLVPASFSVSVTSNAPSNRSAPDVVIQPNNSGGFIIQLRAEKDGSAERVYSLSARVSDRAGNTKMVTADCIVPHDSRN